MGEGIVWEELEEGCMSMRKERQVYEYEGRRKIVYEKEEQEKGCVRMKEGGRLVYVGEDQGEGCVRMKEGGRLVQDV